MELSVAFGKVLRQLRKNANLTQEELAFEVGLQRTYISILELGQQQPSISTIFKLAKSFNKTAGQIMDLVEIELLD